MSLIRKPHLFAAAVGLLPIGGVHAQSSVTVYGLMDMGLEYANHQSAGGHVTRLTSGNLSGSRWGLRGTEDLGGGQKAVFVIESGFDPDTGNSGQGGRLFGRMAYVGLQGPWGAFTAGRQQSMIFDLGGRFDAMALAPRYSIINQDTAFVARYDNSLKYAGSFGAVNLGAIYSTGTESKTADGSEVPGHSRLGRAYGFRVDTKIGPAGLGTAYDEVNSGTLTVNPGATARRAIAAMTYQFGAVTAYAGYRWARISHGATLSGAPAGSPGSNLWWTGARWQATPALTLAVAAYYQDFKKTSRDPWLFVAMGDYALSKRTDVYLSVGYTKNKDDSNLGLGAGGGGFGSTTPGSNQAGITVGLRHKF